MSNAQHSPLLIDGPGAYKMRDGQRAVVTKPYEGCFSGEGWAWLGFCDGKAMIWQADGSWLRDGESTFDIVSRWEEPEDHFARLQAKFPRGTELSVEHDGFAGTVVGYYVTREGKPGLVLQLHNAKVVHVYSEKWFGDRDG